MPATREKLRAWFDEGAQKGATHMIVKCDAFEYRGGRDDGCCYPIFVSPGEDPRERAEGGDRLMEVYDLTGDKAAQIETHERVMNWSLSNPTIEEGGEYMKTIELKNGNKIRLREVEREDETAVIGVTETGKRFVVAASHVKEEDPLPARHPYRVYLHTGEVLRVIDPPFEESEQAFLTAPEHAQAKLRLEDGSFRPITRGEVLSLLSATPEAQAHAEQGNGQSEREPDDGPDEAEIMGGTGQRAW